MWRKGDGLGVERPRSKCILPGRCGEGGRETKFNEVEGREMIEISTPQASERKESFMQE